MAPGRCNDSSIYSGSNLAQVIQHPIYSKQFTLINGVKVQAHLIADSAFALNPTLMKPYATKSDMPRQHTLFNYRLSRCRSTVERSFGALKNRFRCLYKKNGVRLASRGHFNQNHRCPPQPMHYIRRRSRSRTGFASNHLPQTGLQCTYDSWERYQRSTDCLFFQKSSVKFARFSLSF